MVVDMGIIAFWITILIDIIILIIYYKKGWWH